MMQTHDLKEKTAEKGREVCPSCGKVGLPQFVNGRSILVSVVHVYKLDSENYDFEVLEECTIE